MSGPIWAASALGPDHLCEEKVILGCPRLKHRELVDGFGH